MNADRAPGAVAFGLLAIALIGLAFVSPWFTADYSSGRQTPPQGMQPSEETGVVRHSLTDTPFATQGDVTPTDPTAHTQWVTLIGWLTTTGLVCALVVVLAEVPGILRRLVRNASLAAGTVACLSLVGVALVAWFLLPGSVGVSNTPFASVLLSDGYWRTSLGWGWSLAALAVPMLLAAMGSKYQAGSHDPAAVEGLAKA